jgi:hypothetical protein
MRTAVIALAILALPVLPAAAQPADGDMRPMGQAGPAAMSLSDFQAMQRARMMRMDTDHDGRVSLAEWAAWHAAHPGHGAGGDPARMFQRLDLNHDGYVSADEIDAASARRFARMHAGRQGGAGEGDSAPVEPLPR